MEGEVTGGEEATEVSVGTAKIVPVDTKAQRDRTVMRHTPLGNSLHYHL